MDPNNTSETITRLFPTPAKPVSLRGRYLDESLRPAGTPAQPFVYASFITSLDGRISLPDPATGTRKVPQATANPRDWRLFQELAASADVVVTSGRYIRDLAAGNAQANLPVSNKPEFADLLEWRSNHGLKPQPDVVIVTFSLDLPIPEALLQSNRTVYVATGSANNSSQIKSLEAQGVRLLETGTNNRVEGQALIEVLAREGFGNIDMIAGGQLLNTLLTDNVLDRLYLTQACRLLGGSSFDTLLKGPQLDPPADFKIRSLFYDNGTASNTGQLFTVFDKQVTSNS